MHDAHAVLAVLVRVRVGDADTPVGRPAGVTDPGSAEPWPGPRLDQISQHLHAAGGAKHRRRLTIDLHRDSGGVIAAVFEKFQACDQVADGIRRALAGDDSAHDVALVLNWRRRVSSPHWCGRRSLLLLRPGESLRPVEWW